MAAIILIPLVLTRLITSIQYWVSVYLTPSISLPFLPYTIPFVAHGIAMVISPYRHFTSALYVKSWNSVL